jgi:hypothetical protein
VFPVHSLECYLFSKPICSVNIFLGNDNFFAGTPSQLDVSSTNVYFYDLEYMGVHLYMHVNTNDKIV